MLKVIGQAAAGGAMRTHEVSEEEKSRLSLLGALKLESR